MKILLIEDELVWQIKIRMILEELGWELVKITSSIDSIEEDIATTQYNLILSDIVLDDISVFTFFKEMTDCKTPIVFMTNRPSESYYESTKNLSYSALLIKPFHALTLKSTVDLLFKDYKEPIEENSEPQKPSEHGIWVKGKHNLKVWVEEEKILWIHSNGNYCYIQTATAKYSIKAALSNLVHSFSDSFIQIHRAYLINVQYIQKIELTRHNLYINKQELPISRKYKEQVVQYLLKKEANE
jgi:DNA-binding LytR/AlgR family response regulator